MISPLVYDETSLGRPESCIFSSSIPILRVGANEAKAGPTPHLPFRDYIFSALV